LISDTLITVILMLHIQWQCSSLKVCSVTGDFPKFMSVTAVWWALEHATVFYTHLFKVLDSKRAQLWGRVVWYCAYRAPPNYGAFSSSMRQTVWLSESWPNFYRGKAQYPI